MLGKTIVVTGISSGIGARIGELALAHGRRRHRPRRQPAAVRRWAPLSRSTFVLAPGGGRDSLKPSLPARFDALVNVAGVSGVSGAQEDARDQFLRPARAERGAGAANPRGRRRRQHRLHRRLRLARQPRTRQGDDRAGGLSRHRCADRRAQGGRRRGLSALEGTAAACGPSAPRTIPCSGRARSASTRSALGPVNDADPQGVPRGVRRSPRRRGHRARRPRRLGARHRAGGAVPLLGRRALDQRRQPARRWRVGSLDQRHRPGL